MSKTPRNCRPSCNCHTPDKLSTGKYEAYHGSPQDTPHHYNTFEKARIRKAAAAVFEGFSVGMKHFGNSSLVFNHTNGTWQIYWTLDPSGTGDPHLFKFEIPAHHRATKHWCWTLTPGFLQSPPIQTPSMYSLGREQARTLSKQYNTLMNLQDSDSPEPDPPTPPEPEAP
jgi:hypothetical protein